MSFNVSRSNNDDQLLFNTAKAATPKSPIGHIQQFCAWN